MDKNSLTEQQMYLFPVESTSLSEEHRVKDLVSQENKKDCETNDPSFASPIANFLKLCAPDILSGKMCRVSLVQGGGEDFKAFLREIDEIGYSIAWRVLDAQYVRVDGYPRAVPQRRRRVFVVGCFGDWKHPASILFEPEMLHRNSPPRRVKGQGFTDNTEIISRKSIKNQSAISIGNGQLGEINASLEECSQTLHCMHDHSAIIAYNPKTPDVGFEKSPTIPASVYKDPTIICFHGSQDPISNGDHANSVNRNNGLENCLCQYGNVAGTLTERFDSSPCTDRGQNIVYAYDCYNQQETGEIAKTLQTEHHGTNLQVIAVRTANTNANGIGCSEENAYTIDNSNGQAVCFPIDIRNATRSAEKHDKTNRQGIGVGNADDPSATLSVAHIPGIAFHSIVRRLLPIECERLMGFPDNWTFIPVKTFKSKPRNKRFAKHPELFRKNQDGTWNEMASDSPRYKACGNSMCVNVMRWIGMRIENLERKINK